ncbi:epithelial membrane protein 2 isoform X2 [Chelonia mydas]|uniref:epithelial membrane protein 2 isoform X2 n=1 Tax=Chelonia mydas TaxID=8469 RepID=UPI001CA82DB9|nr:epithelial membrane protein 2 isoform X2 [Chelonia mydas]
MPYLAETPLPPHRPTWIPLRIQSQTSGMNSEEVVGDMQPWAPATPGARTSLRHHHSPISPRERFSAAATAALRGSPSTPAERLRADEEKERTLDDMFKEILLASAASDCAQRAWRLNIADSLEKERVDRRKAQDAHQERRQR